MIFGNNTILYNDTRTLQVICNIVLSRFFNLYIHTSNLYFVMHDGNLLLRWKSLLPKTCHFKICNPTFKCHTLCSILINLFYVPFGGNVSTHHDYLWKLTPPISTLSSFSFSNNSQCIWLMLGAAVAEWLSSWLAEQEDRGSIPGLATWIFRDWLSPAFKSRYGWKIAKSTLILKTTNQPNDWCYFECQ